MKKYKFCISPREYERFRTHKATRLYLHSWNGVELTVESGNKRPTTNAVEVALQCGALHLIDQCTDEIEDRLSKEQAAE